LFQIKETKKNHFSLNINHLLYYNNKKRWKKKKPFDFYE